MQHRLATGAVALSAICYGTLALFGKMATQAGVAVPALLFWRFLLGGAVLWGVVALTRTPLPRGRSALVAAGIGLFFAGMSSAYFVALVRAGADYAVLTLYAYPAVVVSIEHALGNRITLRRAFTAVLAVLGVALLVHPGKHVDALGIVAGLASACCYGVYLVLASRVMQRMPPLSATAIIVSAMAPIFFCIAVVLRAPLAMTREASALIGIFSVVSTALPIALLSWGIARIGAPRAAVLGTLEPLTAIVLIALFAGERLDLVQLAGACCLIISSALPDAPVAVALEG